MTPAARNAKPESAKPESAKPESAKPESTKPESASPMVNAPAEDATRGDALPLWPVLLLMNAASALLAVLEVFLVPLYAGGVIVPVSVALAVVSNWLVPVVIGRLGGSLPAAVAPLVVWLIVVGTLGMVPRPEGDVLVPGGGGPEYVYFAMLLGGVLVGSFASVIVATPRPDHVKPPRG